VDPSVLAQLERIAGLGIGLVPVHGLSGHFVFERAGCAVIVERRGEGFGSVGSPGQLTGGGFAALVEREGKLCFVNKADVRPAGEAEAAEARRLYSDLRSVLG
jgi:hypothetical protein